ncbi:hypothetical protein M011DRAFT_463057 [Sporormia fimetaria CBS 119925]|uniref:Uncharacterized protein n=1 Tax=Sporormia fimetaria CBS 119925 TaxID=1340428 RepID=A0A6A6UU54_9PLEO|nr:hypothetical protein M011DRAFT_463057 [Sporormia fimetaria CBS 119925]
MSYSNASSSGSQGLPNNLPDSRWKRVLGAGDFNAPAGPPAANFYSAIFQNVLCDQYIPPHTGCETVYIRLPAGAVKLFELRSGTQLTGDAQFAPAVYPTAPKRGLQFNQKTLNVCVVQGACQRNLLLQFQPGALGQVVEKRWISGITIQVL